MHCPLSAVEEGLWGRSQALEKVVNHFPVTSICICTLMYLLSYNIILMYIQTKNIYMIIVSFIRILVCCVLSVLANC